MDCEIISAKLFPSRFTLHLLIHISFQTETNKADTEIIPKVTQAQTDALAAFLLNK